MNNYDPKKDKILKSWRIPVTENQAAVINLVSYDGGDPRLQIGVLEISQSDGVIYSRIKRWDWDSLLQLKDVIDQALEKMDKLAVKASKSV